MAGAARIWTIGHSNHSIGRFLELLAAAGITAVADVRSMPHSRRHPQFSKAALARSLAGAGVAYVWLGDTLGGRPRDPALFRDGRPDYERMAATGDFQAGLDRVLEGAARHRVALMCAERAPLDCHRTLLVSRHLAAAGTRIVHLLADGTAEPHEQTERALLAQAGDGDLFSGTPDLAGAYRMHTANMFRG